jgi:hypothetical protein
MPELLESADWAFGPEGLPKLGILGYRLIMANQKTLFQVK